MPEEGKRGYPVKTTIGVGLALLYLFRGKGGWGIGGKIGYSRLGLMPQELQKMLTVGGDGSPTDVVRLILAPDGLSLQGKPAKLDDIIKYSSWFNDGKIKLVVTARGDTIQKDVVKLQEELGKSTIQKWYMS